METLKNQKVKKENIIRAIEKYKNENLLKYTVSGYYERISGLIVRLYFKPRAGKLIKICKHIKTYNDFILMKKRLRENLSEE